MTTSPDLQRLAERLHAADVRQHLRTRWIGLHLHCFDRVGSTNTVAREMAVAGAPHGTVVLADQQDRGRGRLGRSWVSPAGKNLYLSVILRAALPDERIPQIGLLAGVAACDAVREWHDATIKWPNDVLIEGRKVGGILAEVEGGATGAVVLGIGLNLNSGAEDFPEELRDKASSLAIATRGRVDRACVTGRLLTHLERRYDEFLAAGFAPIRGAWRERCGTIGRIIRVEEAGAIVTGEALDIDADGALLVRLASGADRRILAGDVTVVDGYGRGGAGPRVEAAAGAQRRTP